MLGLWIGSVVFFSFFAAPGLFGALPREAAGRAVSAIFPRYYALGAACGVLALLSGLLLRSQGAFRGRTSALELLLVALMTGIVVYSGYVLLPQASRARAAWDESQATPVTDSPRERFEALHRRSVLLNGAVLLLGLAAFLLAANERPSP